MCINLYQKNKIATVIKHIPGHGASRSDSHYSLPVIKANKSELIKKDFMPFRMCQSIFAMTAHIVYAVYDPIHTATHSEIVINDVIRKHIGFKGLLISDDISMKALKYSIEENTIRAFNAGCSLVLHCNANYFEMLQVAKNSPIVSKFIIKKTSQFINIVR